MDLGLSQFQQMLRATARGLLERQCPTTLVRDMEGDPRGFPPDLWRRIAEQGWLGLAAPERYGGEGGDFVDLCVLLEEMGRFLAPGPFRSTVTEGALPLMAFGSESQRQSLLPAIVRGECIVALAHLEPSASHDAAGVQMPAAQDKEGYVLNGTKLFVRYGTSADYFIVPVRSSQAPRPESGVTCLLTPANAPGVIVQPLDTIADDKQSEVAFNGVRVPLDAVLGEVDRGWEVVQWAAQRAAVAECAWMLGGQQAVLDMTVQYVSQRVQFGRPVGSFQAVQHHCANMAIDVAASRNITYRAAWQLATSTQAEYDVALAKGFVSDAYQRICVLAHQCHGAIAFTSEHDLQLYTRRAKASELAFGNADVHREGLARILERAPSTTSSIPTATT